MRRGKEERVLDLVGKGWWSRHCWPVGRRLARTGLTRLPPRKDYCLFFSAQPFVSHYSSATTIYSRTHQKLDKDVKQW